MFPEIGADVPYAVDVLTELSQKHNLILFTMRSDRNTLGDTGGDGILDVTGLFLTKAVQWFVERGIPLAGIQTNPTQRFWTTSPKAYGNIYIDDAALGCPLIYPEGERPYVDWQKVRRLLVEQGAL
jgi:hypothetical protein